MSANVHDRLADQKPDLVKLMVSNKDISGTVMAYLNLLCGMSFQFNYPITGVRIDAPSITHTGLFRAKVHFNRVMFNMPRLFGTQSDFASYAHAKAAHLAYALYKNPSLEKFFEKMVVSIENWGKARGIPFEYISIVGPDYEGQGPVISQHDHVMTFKLKRRLDIV